MTRRTDTPTHRDTDSVRGGPRLIPLISGLLTLLLGLAVGVSLLTGRGIPMGFPMDARTPSAGGSIPPAADAPVEPVESRDFGRVTGGELPEWSFAGADGKPITSGDLRDEVWVADFIFTECPAACPVMSASYADMQAAVQADPALAGLKLVSFSIDPADDAQRLIGYGERYGRDPSIWRMAEGSEAAQQLSRDRFGLLAEPNEIVGDPEPGELPFVHSDKLALVDRGGVIRGFYSGQDPAAVQRLKADAAVLLARSAAGAEPGA